MLYCMVKKGGMHGFPHGIVSTKREGHVTHPTTYFGSWKIRLDPLCRQKKVYRIFAVLFHSRSNRENIGVKNDVLRVKFYLIYKHTIASLTDFYASLIGVGLAFFVKSHHHYGSTKFLNGLRLLDKFFLPVFEGNGVHNTLPLHTLQSCKDYAPLGTIDHDRNTADLWLRSDQIEEANHRKFPVEHPFVHADVDHLGTASHLI